MSSSLFYDCYAPYESYPSTIHVDGDKSFGEIQNNDSLYILVCDCKGYLFDELKENNYKINLHFIGLDSPQTAKERVKIRVSKGGHDIEPYLIDKRYYESMQNLLKVIPLCNEILVYDNTKNYELIAKITNEKIDILKNVEWFNNLILEKNKISKLFL